MKAAGYILVEGPRGPTDVGQTMQCPHCNAHFVMVKGSGKLRSFCMGCHSVTCGAPKCVSGCYPYEKKMDDIDKGRLLVTDL